MCIAVPMRVYAYDRHTRAYIYLYIRIDMATYVGAYPSAVICTHIDITAVLAGLPACTQAGVDIHVRHKYAYGTCA